MKKTNKGGDGVKSQEGYRNAILGIFLITALFGSGLYLAYDEAGITGMVGKDTTILEYDENTKYLVGGGTTSRELSEEEFNWANSKGLLTVAGVPPRPAEEPEAEEAISSTGDTHYGQLPDGSYVTGPKNILGGMKDVTKVGKISDNRRVQDGILITTTGKDGPSTLNYGGETITLPADSEIDLKTDINRNTFAVLHIFAEQSWGGLEDLTVTGSGDNLQFNFGNLRGFTSGDNVIVQDLVGGSTVYWSTQTVVHSDGSTTTYDCDSAGDKCAGDTVVSGDYTSEKRAPDGVTVTQIVNKQDTQTTTTNFRQLSVDGGPPRNVIQDPDDSGTYYYSDVGLFGLQWHRVSDCDEDGCEDIEIKDSELPSNAEDAGKQALYGGGWNLFGNILSQWRIATAGYSGMSLLYDEPDPIIELDETMSTLLGGIDGWTSLICKSEMTDSLDSGMAFSSNPDGAYAHVEGEKILVEHYNETPPIKSQYYKISASVTPGGQDTGCDIKFSLYLAGSGGKLYLYAGEGGNVNYSASEKSYELKRGDGGISYAGSAMELIEDERNFDKVCIKFHDLYPEFVSAGEGCLIGVNEGDEICNDVNDLSAAAESFDDPCSNNFGFIAPNCWL